MASAPRHGDVSRVNWVPQVKPDQWGPLVSDPGLFSVNGRWGRVKGHVSRVNADGWGHWISFNSGNSRKCPKLLKIIEIQP